MMFANSTRFRRRTLAAIATAGVATALVLTSAVPARTQAPSPPTAAEAWEMMGDDTQDSPRLHGYLLDNGEFTIIDAPGAILGTGAVGINNRGHIVGATILAVNPTTALGFLLAKGDFTTVQFPGALSTEPVGVNNRRQIVGTYVDSSNTAHGFLLDRSVFTTIDHPDAAPRGSPDFASGATLGTAAFGINNRGQIVGQYGDASGRIHAFLLADGVFTTIEAPGAINTNASDINERGQVVGFYLSTSAGQ
jgi:probable HAF family extracellular repeat protein